MGITKHTQWRDQGGVPSRQVWTVEHEFHNMIVGGADPPTKLGLVRMAPGGDGQLSLTRRFSGQWAFRMDFRWYPFDAHALPLEVSAGHTHPKSFLAFSLLPPTA